MNNIKEQIRAEIDKLYAEYKDKFHQHGDQYHLGLIDGLDMAERVLDSLPEEKPSKGLDVTDFCKPIDPGIAQCIADHWWEMLDDEPTPSKKCEKTEESALKKCEEVDLEEAAEEKYPVYWKDYPKDGIARSESFYDTNKQCRDAFIAGAEWQKEQMLEEVEIRVLNYVLDYIKGDEQ